MAFAVLFLIPFLIVNTIYFLFSRRRISFPFAIWQGTFGICTCLIVCVLYLIPLERMILYSHEGMLQISIGKTTLLVLPLVASLLGILLGIFTKEEFSIACAEKRNSLSNVLFFIFLFVLILLTQGYFWGRIVYSTVSVEEILFHLSMPLEGTASGFIRSIIHSVFLPSILAFFPIAVFGLFPCRKYHNIVLFNKIHIPLFPLRFPHRVFVPLLIVWFCLLLFAADSMLGIRAYIRGCMTASTFIEENYVSPDDVTITFPETKRNLISIYLESFESTTQDVDNGGVLYENLIPEMTQLAKEHVSFSRNELITGAIVPPHCSWTMSGLIAQTAALPLMHIINQGDQFGSLLPGAITLGDLLKEQGYRLVFMAGSDFTFGGRRTYFGTHGDYEIWDLLVARDKGLIPQDYNENWGFEDLKLYEYAKDMLLELSQGNQPFHFSILTADTHSPGYRCPQCPTNYQNKGSDALNYADAIQCASAQLSSFLDWCQQQPFYENTTIVVTGDHLSMQDFFYRNILGSQQAAENAERYVYNAFINAPVAPVKEKNRLFTTMDIFPSTLASLGVSIEGNRLSLGTNLFSEEQTLSEQYGEEYLFSELEKKSVFYDKNLFYWSK